MREIVPSFLYSTLAVVAGGGGGIDPLSGVTGDGSIETWGRGMDERNDK